jgi:hypothetical protein
LFQSQHFFVFGIVTAMQVHGGIMRSVLLLLFIAFSSYSFADSCRRATPTLLVCSNGVLGTVTGNFISFTNGVTATVANGGATIGFSNGVVGTASGDHVSYSNGSVSNTVGGTVTYSGPAPYTANGPAAILSNPPDLGGTTPSEISAPSTPPLASVNVDCGDLMDRTMKRALGTLRRYSSEVSDYYARINLEYILDGYLQMRTINVESGLDSNIAEAKCQADKLRVRSDIQDFVKDRFQQHHMYIYSGEHERDIHNALVRIEND